MDAFYREVRRDSGVLMDQGKPIGGKFSMDTENRLIWRGKPLAPSPPRFPRDPIKAEVAELIQTRFANHPGHLDMDILPATQSDAKQLWSWAKTACLPDFGPYEDAMSLQSRGLFHTRISSLVNLHRLLPSKVLSEVIELDIPLSSKEGFIRQVLGWREFVRHVHLATDGFRHLPSGPWPLQSVPGDGGYRRWSGKVWSSTGRSADPEGGAAPSHLGGETPLPPAYWGEPSGLACLDHVVASVWEEGYSHHITRLMILSNLATLLDVRPRELTDWFWVSYADAYDWVVEPNVLGMGTFALGDLMMTKPYVSGAAYINRMSDYCNVCAFDPKTNCPITPLYWAFLERHKDKLEGNPRLRMPMAGLGKRSTSQKRKDQLIFRLVKERLLKGDVLRPDSLKV
jgi:deoxyribodipyrimidine photolyase-related protein